MQVAMNGTNTELVSVVIPCFNAGHYLNEAIQSVLAQTHARIELLVVDDGSTDRTEEVACSYPQVIYLRQRNQGVASARNTGLRSSIGDYVVFLDGDDRLLPHAVEAGLKCLRKHPKSGLVYGRYRKIDARGTVISPPTQPSEEPDFYAALLRRNPIGMPAIVLYPRCVLEKVKGFEPRFSGYDDYELYLRIAREFPVHRHDDIVAEYRKHDQNFTRNYRFMLEGSIRVLRCQMPYVKPHALYREALAAGISNWRNHYGHLMVDDFRKYVETRGIDRGTIRRFRNLALCYPRGVGSITKSALRKAFRKITKQN
jgi:glycosyltransferase involved in cell wall biosynthesis